MRKAIQVRTHVLPGNRVEVTDPGLQAGQAVEVIILSDPMEEDRLAIDTDFLEECEADEGPVPSLEEVRAAMSKIPGSMAAEIIADREYR